MNEICRYDPTISCNQNLQRSGLDSEITSISSVSLGIQPSSLPTVHTDKEEWSDSTYISGENSKNKN